MTNWDPKLGIWKWWIFRGTTPRNAGVWTLDIVVGKYELWIGTGKHAYITFFSGPEEKWSVEREPDDCDCYGCSMNNWRISPEVAAAMTKAMKEGPHVHVGEDSLRKCEDRASCQGKLPDRD